MFLVGVRNPWRFSFNNDGRLIIADVGQDLYEEIHLANGGENLGWNIKEGYHCFKNNPLCEKFQGAEPIYEYGREDGSSITGGYLYRGNQIDKLKNMYIFGDFVSGRIWAIPVKEKVSQFEILSLGKWPMLISTFGQDSKGNIYTGDFANGAVYQISPVSR